MILPSVTRFGIQGQRVLKKIVIRYVSKPHLATLGGGGVIIYFADHIFEIK
jgi:hypothetical protein